MGSEEWRKSKKTLLEPGKSIGNASSDDSSVNEDNNVEEVESHETRANSDFLQPVCNSPVAK